MFCVIVMTMGSICPVIASSYYGTEADVYNVLHYGAIGFNFIDNSQVSAAMLISSIDLHLAKLR